MRARRAPTTGGWKPPSGRILEEIGEDPDRQGLVGTPERVHRMYTELTAGYHVDPERLINNAVFDVDYSEMVIVKDIPFYSLCEHHLLPFFGTASVAYIPRGRVIGLSKIPRIVEMYARRLQVQERLTQQIAEFLQERLQPQGVGRRPRGDPPVRRDARRTQARHDHDHVVGARAVPDPRPDALGIPRPSRPKDVARGLNRADPADLRRRPRPPAAWRPRRSPRRRPGPWRPSTCSIRGRCGPPCCRGAADRARCPRRRRRR